VTLANLEQFAQPPHPGTHTDLRRIVSVFPIACGLIAVFSGAAVLYGWTFDIEILKSLRPGWLPMTPVTALCLFLLGVALFSHVSARASWLRLAAGAGVATLEGIKLASIFMQSDSFVDRLLFAAKLSEGVSVAPNTAVCLGLLALATLALAGFTPRLTALGRLFAIGAALIVTLALLGYAAGIFGFYQIGGDIPMRLQTAMTAALLALGLLFVRDPHAASDAIDANIDDKPPLNATVIAAIFGVLLLILSATFWGEHQSSGTADLAFQTQTRALETSEILSTLQDAEVGQRGYLLTQNESFLSPYTAAISKISELTSALGDPQRNDPAAAAHVPELQRLITQRMEILEETVVLAKQGRWDHAQAIVRAGRGRDIMDQIRLVIADINAARNAMLRDQRDQRDRISLIVLITEIIGVVFLAVTGLIVMRQTRVAMNAQRRARDAATTANKAKSAFLASMSHELRTPMTGIMGMCDLLLAGEQSAEDRNITRMLARSAQTLLGLLNDILDLSKIEAGHLTIESIDFRLSIVMEDVASLFGPSASKKGLLLKVETAPGAHDVLKGDAKRLQQILSNLIGNAIKFTERGVITVRAATSLQPSGAVLLECDITDTGIGISDEAKGRLFRDFEQEDASTSRRFGGTGLGLSISKRLAVAMGGSIGVESARGIGSRFHFSIPFIPGDPQAVAARISSNALSAADHLRGMRLDILLAEDTPATQQLITIMLSRWGHTVRTAVNGMEAVKAAGERPWDIHPHGYANARHGRPPGGYGDSCRRRPLGQGADHRPDGRRDPGKPSGVPRRGLLGRCDQADQLAGTGPAHR
jgi:signal transduction histidine kinase